MSEIRLYVTTTESKAEEILDLLSAVFGEEDFAIGTTEIDENDHRDRVPHLAHRRHQWWLG
ncbi:hypothetical protein ACCS96_39460, partial [Rhizobium ruizarguesonis]